MEQISGFSYRLDTLMTRLGYTGRGRPGELMDLYREVTGEKVAYPTAWRWLKGDHPPHPADRCLPPLVAKLLGDADSVAVRDVCAWLLWGGPAPWEAGTGQREAIYRAMLAYAHAEVFPLHLLNDSEVDSVVRAITRQMGTSPIPDPKIVGAALEALRKEQ